MLRNLVEQVKNYDEELLTAGLTVLAKDLAEYLAATAHPGDDSRLFLEVYTTALNTERQYWEKFGPELFRPLEQDGLPRGFAQAAAEGKPDLGLLCDRSIIHEWTRFPGRDLIQKFKIKLKETICGKDGPFEKFQKGLVGQADLPVAIASSILAAGFSIATFWYPLAVYIALLLIKAGLKTYCES